MIDFVPNSKTETSNRNDLMAFLFFSFGNRGRDSVEVYKRTRSRGRPRHRDQPVLSAHVTSLTHLLFVPRPSVRPSVHREENPIQSTNLFRLGQSCRHRSIPHTRGAHTHKQTPAAPLRSAARRPRSPAPPAASDPSSIGLLPCTSSLF